MAAKKSNFVARFARGAALASAIGSSTPASATPTEQSQASQMYRSQNSARNSARQAVGSEENAIGLELDDIQASIDPGSTGNPSLQATPDGQGGIKLKLKFDVPLKQSSRDRVNEVIQKSQQKRDSQRTPTNPPTSDTQNQPGPSSDTPENTDQGVEASRANNDLSEKAKKNQQQMGEQLGNSTNTQGENTEENPFPLSDAEPGPSSAQDSEEGVEEDGDETEEGQSKFLDQALKEEQIREQALEQERGKKQQEMQKKRNLGMRILQQTQGQEMAMKEDQQRAQKLNRLMRIKQNLDRKINMLRLKKLPLTVTLRTLQISKLFILIIRGLLAVLIAILYLTVILAVIGLILKGFDWLLKFVQYGISKVIDLLKKEIKKIDKDIDKAKEDRKKAINVIQLIQKQKRVGARAPAPKFNVSQAG